MPTQKKHIVAFIGFVLIAGLAWQQHQAAKQQSQAAAETSQASPQIAKRGQSNAKKRGDKPIPVQVTSVHVADVPVIYNALGTAIPSAVVTVTSRVNGQLSAVVFQEGQLVKQGQLLAKIDARPFESALGQMQGQAMRNQALLKNSEIDLERFKTLQSQDSIASQQVDAQASLVQQYQGTVLADRAALEAAKLQVAFTNITAPISGRIGLRQVDAGNNITTTNPIAVINAVQPINVVFTIPEDSISQLIRQQQRGGTSALKVEAWDKSNTRLLAKGSLSSLDNQIDTTSGTLKLKAQFANVDLQLFPNQFVNIKLLGQPLLNAHVIPLNALQHGPQGDFVYVVTKAPHSTAAQAANPTDKTRNVQQVSVKAVTVGHRTGEIAAITAGLTAGEQVVTSGLDKLREGAKVVVKSQVQDADTQDNVGTQPQRNATAQDLKQHG